MFRKPGDPVPVAADIARVMLPPFWFVPVAVPPSKKMLPLFPAVEALPAWTMASPPFPDPEVPPCSLAVPPTPLAAAPPISVRVPPAAVLGVAVSPAAMARLMPGVVLPATVSVMITALGTPLPTNKPGTVPPSGLGSFKPTRKFVLPVRVPVLPMYWR